MSRERSGNRANLPVRWYEPAPVPVSIRLRRRSPDQPRRSAVRPAGNRRGVDDERLEVRDELPDRHRARLGPRSRSALNHLTSRQVPAPTARRGGSPRTTARRPRGRRWRKRSIAPGHGDDRADRGGWPSGIAPRSRKRKWNWPARRRLGVRIAPAAVARRAERAGRISSPYVGKRRSPSSGSGAHRSGSTRQFSAQTFRCTRTVGEARMERQGVTSMPPRQQRRDRRARRRAGRRRGPG
jgi:hypothetical protein